jgi:hypothetical protein
MSFQKAKKWHYFISWDNPYPADSRTMLRDLRCIGAVTRLQTKTSIALIPYEETTWQDVRDAIKNNLHPRRGKAFYVNLRSGRGFEIGRATAFKWKQVS